MDMYIDRNTVFTYVACSIVICVTCFFGAIYFKSENVKLKEYNESAKEYIMRSDTLNARYEEYVNDINEYADKLEFMLKDVTLESLYNMVLSELLKEESVNDITDDYIFEVMYLNWNTHKRYIKLSDNFKR